MTNETGTSSPGGGPAVALAAGARAGPPGGGALGRGARAGPKKSRKLAKDSGKREKSTIFLRKKLKKRGTGAAGGGAGRAGAAAAPAGGAGGAGGAVGGRGDRRGARACRAGALLGTEVTISLHSGIGWRRTAIGFKSVQCDGSRCTSGFLTYRSQWRSTGIPTTF